VELVATHLAADDELRVLEDLEMVHHSKPGHTREERAQLQEGLAVLIEEFVQYPPTMRVVEGL